VQHLLQVPAEAAAPHAAGACAASRGASGGA
jgi:hypothetical protein